MTTTNASENIVEFLKTFANNWPFIAMILLEFNYWIYNPAKTCS